MLESYSEPKQGFTSDKAAFQKGEIDQNIFKAERASFGAFRSLVFSTSI